MGRKRKRTTDADDPQVGTSKRHARRDSSSSPSAGPSTSKAARTAPAEQEAALDIDSQIKALGEAIEKVKADHGAKAKAERVVDQRGRLRFYNEKYELMTAHRQKASEVLKKGGITPDQRCSILNLRAKARARGKNAKDSLRIVKGGEELAAAELESSRSKAKEHAERIDSLEAEIASMAAENQARLDRLNEMRAEQQWSYHHIHMPDTAPELHYGYDKVIVDLNQKIRSEGLDRLPAEIAGKKERLAGLKAGKGELEKEVMEWERINKNLKKREVGRTGGRD